jgi:hypothetical protein
MRNTVSTFRTLLVSSLIAAGVAFAAPVFAFDVEQYKAGHIPTSGSVEEADTCAVVSALYLTSAMAEPGYANPTPDDQEYYDRVANQAVYWVNRGTKLKGVTGDAYIEEIKLVLGPVSEMGREVNFPHYERCLNIWYTNVGGNIGGSQ